MGNTLFWMRALAGGISLLWVAWWAFFVGANIVGEGMPPPVILTVVTVALLAGFAATVLAWAREGVAGSVLVAEGVVFLILSMTLFQRQPFVIGTLAAPPLVAGLLLLIYWRFSPANG